MRDLTERQRTALWLRAQGLTATAIGKRLDPPTSRDGAQSTLHEVIVKLNARDSTHAVFLALVTGVIGSYQDCGTRRAWLRHIRRQEQSCIACRKANTAYVRAQRDAVPLPDPDAGWVNTREKKLSSRQLEVLRLIQDGAMSGTEVSAKLGIGTAGARKLINGMMKKFGIDSITYAKPVSYPMAVRRGIELGYLEERPDAGRSA